MLLDPHAHDHGSLTDLAFTELRRAARAEPSVIEALFGVLEALARVAQERPHPRAAELRAQADAALQAALQANQSDGERQRLTEAFRRLLPALAGGEHRD